MIKLWYSLDGDGYYYWRLVVENSVYTSQRYATRRNAFRSIQQGGVRMAR